MKEQDPVFPDWSVHVCDTTVVVSAAKKEGDVLDLSVTIAVPDTSLQVGTVHVTVAPGVPSSILSIMSAGLFTQTGGVLSTAVSVKMKIKTFCKFISVIFVVKT